MTTQTEMFPKTTMEVLESLRAFHAADVEKAVAALDNLSDDEKVARRYEKAEERLAAARDLVRDIDRAIHELGKMDRGKRFTPTVNRRTGESVTREVYDDCTLTASITPAVDPITGEVAPAVVVALYPDDDEPHVTKVGDRTRYGELVADYFTAVGRHDEHAEDWEVVAVRELQDGGGYRNLHDIIIPADYGQELLVVALEQGSVTGAPVEKVAT